MERRWGADFAEGLTSSMCCSAASIARHNELRLNIDENLDDLFGCKLASWAGAELRILYEVPSFCVQLDVPCAQG